MSIWTKQRPEGPTAEETAQLAQWERDRELETHRLEDVARAEGYRRPLFTEPFIPYLCPVCACSVTLHSVERHSAWHRAAG